MNKAIRILNDKIVNNTGVLDKEVLKRHVKELNTLLDNERLSFFEKGWVYWQLQDHYGLLRDYDSLETIFKSFVTYIKNNNPDYLMWCCCDMTQVLTLRLGKKDALWEEVVSECNQKDYFRDDMIKMKFEINRAFFGILHDKRVVLTLSKMTKSLKEMKKIVDENQHHPDILYFTLNYFSHRIKLESYQNQDIDNVYLLFLKNINVINKALQKPKQKRSHLFGSWEDITSSKGDYYNAHVGITNILFALKSANRLDLVRELLDLLPSYQLTNKTLISMIGGEV
jgi:hypothetical protein